MKPQVTAAPTLTSMVEIIWFQMMSTCCMLCHHLFWNKRSLLRSLICAWQGILSISRIMLVDRLLSGVFVFCCALCPRIFLPGIGSYAQSRQPGCSNGRCRFLSYVYVSSGKLTFSHQRKKKTDRDTKRTKTRSVRKQKVIKEKRAVVCSVLIAMINVFNVFIN